VANYVLGLAGGGCRFCHKSAAFFKVSKWPTTINSQRVEKPARRGHFGTVTAEHTNTLDESHSGVRGVVGAANQKIKLNSWSQDVSIFWELLWMHPSFYKCFSICFLHLELLGLLKVLLSFTPHPFCFTHSFV
jgi:hypothetical protein